MDDWAQLAEKYSGKASAAPSDEWSALNEKYSAPTQPQQNKTPSNPVKIGKDAFPDFLRAELKNADWATRNIAGAGTALSNLYYGGKQLLGATYDSMRSPTLPELVTGKKPTWNDREAIDNNKIIEHEAPVGAIAGNIAATAIPFGLAGNSLRSAGAVGAGMGALNPVEGAQTLENVAKGKAINTAIGLATGVVGQWLPNKILSSSGNKVAAIEQKIQDKAAQVAASETASARSAAGSAAQNAYRQLEHIRELGTNRALTAEEQLVKASLERELAEKSLDNLLPAAAMKQSTSDAFKEAMKTESDRAAEYAASKLSGQEIKDQIMARVKRYGPAVAGGMVGNVIFPGLGGSVGGAATGLVLRPAIRSMINLSKNPAVQHGLLSPIANSSTLASPLIPATSVALGQGLLGY